jgi:hypothetical protein
MLGKLPPNTPKNVLKKQYLNIGNYMKKFQKKSTKEYLKT